MGLSKHKLLSSCSVLCRKHLGCHLMTWLEWVREEDELLLNAEDCNRRTTCLLGRQSWGAACRLNQPCQLAWPAASPRGRARPSAPRLLHLTRLLETLNNAPYNLRSCQLTLSRAWPTSTACTLCTGKSGGMERPEWAVGVVWCRVGAQASGELQAVFCGLLPRAQANHDGPGMRLAG